MNPDTEIETHEPVQSPGASLADEMYAHRPQLEPEPQPEPEPEVTQAADEEQDDANEDGLREGQEEHAEEGQEEVSAEAQAEVEVTTIEELAEHLETDADWLRSLKITEKVNGKPVEVSIADALSTHRKVAAGDDYLADAKTKAKAMIDESTQQRELLAAATVTIGALLQEAEQSVTAGMSESDWAKLRRDDPAEWAAKKKEAEEKQEKISQMKLQAGQTFQNVEAKLKEATEAQWKKDLPKQIERFDELTDNVWKDEELAKREAVEVNEFMVSLGLEPDDIKRISYNGTFLAMARGAMLYERSKGKVDAAKKKVVKIPKVMKPGKAVEDTKTQVNSDDPASILYG